MAMQSSAELVVRADAAVPARMANQACRIFDVRAGAARRCTRCSPSQLGRWRMAKFGGVLLAGPQTRAHMQMWKGTENSFRLPFTAPQLRHWTSAQRPPTIENSQG